MASSAFITLQSFSYGYGCCIPKLSVPSNPCVVSHVLTFPSPKTSNYMKLNHLPRVSPEGLPTELIEDSKFVPLNADDSQYGPPALLLLGFEVEEALKIQQLLKEMGGEFLEVIFCTEDMITGTLWEAVNTKQPNLDTVKIAKPVPRICFLSGLTGEEMMMFIDSFPETGLEPAVFAALVPNSANTPLQELIEEIMGDHEMLRIFLPPRVRLDPLFPCVKLFLYHTEETWTENTASETHGCRFPSTFLGQQLNSKHIRLFRTDCMQMKNSTEFEIRGTGSAKAWFNVSVKAFDAQIRLQKSAIFFLDLNKRRSYIA
ncbi:unnamed protein product [Camellia sinensis]